MLIVHVHVQVLPQHIEEFKQATIVNAESSRKEPGIARFDVLQTDGDPTRFVLVEVYRDKPATLAHKETAHYRAWAERVTPMLAGERTRVWFQSVSPEDGGW
jgi:(4S)-4-hydroxy-5-phosphonooxypentane-2,3-dione isomerase